MNSRAVLYSAGKNDECRTPAYAVRALLPHLPTGAVYWCPFDLADSEFVIQLEQAGHQVVRSHITEGRDFYRTQPRRWDILVSNPPFTNKAKIFERALSFGKPFALLMTLTWLNDAAPKRLFRERTLQLLMFEERIDYGQGNKITFSSAYFCCDLLSQGILVDSLRRYGMSRSHSFPEENS